VKKGSFEYLQASQATFSADS